MCAVQVDFDVGLMLSVIDVYLPCDSYAYVDDSLGKLYAFAADISSQHGQYAVVGDFNCNPCVSFSVQ